MNSHGPETPGRDAAAADDELPHCACGTHRLSKYSLVDRQYSLGGTLYLLWGGTAVPKKVSFRCVRCGKTFDSSARRSVCRQFIT